MSDSSNNPQVTDIGDLVSFKTEIGKSVLTVCDFSAEWCGPCKAMSPVFKEASETYSNVNFIKIDIDDAHEIVVEANISAVPTFQFYKDGEKVDEFRGAKRELLSEFILKYQ